jgi:serine/threonine protein kinase
MGCACARCQPIPVDNWPAPTAAVAFATFPEYFATTSDPILFEYQFEREIAQGAMCHVYVALNRETNDHVAIKVYSNAQLFRRADGVTEPGYESVQREIELVMKLQHRYIVPMQEVFQEPTTNSTMLVMPLAEFGTLQSVISGKTLPLTVVSIAFLQIAEGMRYLHSLHVAHRDLRPDNVLCFAFDWYMITNFSSAAQSGPVTGPKGAAAFLAPEECDMEPFDPLPTDVWAYGVALYWAVFDQFPFDLQSLADEPADSTVAAIKDLVGEEHLVVPALPEDIDYGVVEVLEKCLEKNPTKRPTFEEIVAFQFFSKARLVDEELQGLVPTREANSDGGHLRHRP